MQEANRRSHVSSGHFVRDQPRDAALDSVEGKEGGGEAGAQIGRQALPSLHQNDSQDGRCTNPIVELN